MTGTECVQVARTVQRRNDRLVSGVRELNIDDLFGHEDRNGLRVGTCRRVTITDGRTADGRADKPLIYEIASGVRWRENLDFQANVGSAGRCGNRTVRVLRPAARGCGALRNDGVTNERRAVRLEPIQRNDEPLRVRGIDAQRRRVRSPGGYGHESGRA